MHVHVVPLKFSLSDAINRHLVGGQWHSAMSLKALRQVHQRGVNYIAVKEPESSWRWTQAPAHVRQFTRRVIADEIGVTARYDYSTNPELANVMMTLSRLQDAA